jgi:hypothetical protein
MKTIPKFPREDLIRKIGDGTSGDKIDMRRVDKSALTRIGRRDRNKYSTWSKDPMNFIHDSYEGVGSDAIVIHESRYVLEKIKGVNKINDLIVEWERCHYDIASDTGDPRRGRGIIR